MCDTDSMRKQVLAQRDMLGPGERKEKSERIRHRFLDLVNPFDPATFFLFVNFRSEVETLELIGQLLESGKTVTVPLVSVNEKSMTAVRLIDPDKDLVPGYYGILEPRKDLLKTRTIDHKTIDIVVLPGSVFDERGGRLGYGGGFYDRFIANEVLPSALRIALAFELQVQSEIPQQPHDQPADFIITEQRVIHGNLDPSRRIYTGR
ncbi:MAG: 5-formyltetrahydrofolate cyclo-ligase [Desulfoprunum sp.]|jgi:5-formyltetrahydrofolate cyclo-ligase|uniref:5-formyltetrahydrofolate cyclo-ligase n=1 Tax=Desulfoprunum sp. TaxID=2020866 RepID=UPI000ADF5BB9